ncbi:MAG TPA: transposase family protein, partial [Thermodesulfobacteriota bacterium]
FIDVTSGLPRSHDGYHALLVVYDGFSRFATAICLKSEKADYIVKEFMTHYIGKFGPPPTHIHSDNGKNMDSSLIRHLCRMIGTIKSSTPIYTPRSNKAEVICGAVVQLIRKGLINSDQKYWPLCVPFVLNAYNSTVHTATGYTPNALFLGRFDEPSPVPLVPFDCEAANVNDYYKKLRRFQELAFQIVQTKNERLAEIKHKQMNKNAITPQFKIGEYVLVKNLKPGTGPGQVKLRPKWIGPFRIIKVYPASLALVPWSVNSKLESFYKDPDLFRIVHRGDVSPFKVQISAIKDCKPYKGTIDNQIVVDPILISNFLDSLEVDQEKEISFIIPSETDSLEEEDKIPELGDRSMTDHISSSSGSTDPSSKPARPDPDVYTNLAVSSSGSSNTTSSVQTSVETQPKPSRKENFWADDESIIVEGGYAMVPSDHSTLDSWPFAVYPYPYAVMSPGHHPSTETDPTPPVESDSSSNDLDLSPNQKEILNQMKRNQRLEERVGQIYDDLYDARKFRQVAEFNALDVRELEKLAKSADPNVRENASRKLVELIEEMRKYASRDLADLSPAHSATEDEAEFDDLIYQQQPDPEVVKRKMLLNCARRIRREADRLSLSGPLSPAVRRQLEKSLIKAKADLEYAKRRTGFEEDIFEPNFDLSDAFKERPYKDFKSPDISDIEIKIDKSSDHEVESNLANQTDSNESELSRPLSRSSSDATRNYSARSDSISSSSQATPEVVEPEKRKPVRIPQELDKENEEIEVSPPVRFKPRPPERHFEGGARADAVS